jgi:hypothetical protein
VDIALQHIRVSRCRYSSSSSIDIGQHLLQIKIRHVTLPRILVPGVV